MDIINCKELTTIHVAGEKTYKLAFSSHGYADIKNDTTDILRISFKEILEEPYSLTLKPDEAYNGLRTTGELYVVANGAGEIGIAFNG